MRASQFGWLLWSLALVAAIATGAIGTRDTVDGPVTASDAALWATTIVVLMAFATVGAVIASRQPGNAVGWLFVCGALAMILGSFGLVFANVFLDPSRAVSATLALLSDVGWITALFLLGPFVFLLFPDGRPPGRRWKLLVWLLAAWLVVTDAAIMLAPGELGQREGIDNPFGVDGAGAVLTICVVAAFPLAVACVVALVVRYRRSQSRSRQQMKWFTFGASVAVATVVGLMAAQDLLESSGVAWDGAYLVAIAIVPITTGIAILRYRLFEIDRVISRTLVYAGLTVVLGAAYVGLVLTGQALSSSFAGGSNLAIAVSTLVVAALFLPLRSRLQRFVDRRFYRRRYDAQRTLEGFGARLREEVDLGTLEHELRGIVTETMQPSHASVWLREARS